MFSGNTGCEAGDGHQDSRRNPRDSEPSTDSGETGHTGDTAHTGETGEVPVAVQGIEAVAVDTTTYAAFGYEVVTFEVTAEAPESYESLYPDTRPTFYVFRPVDVAADEQLPVVLFHHGGAIGDDSVSTPHQCEAGVLQNWVDRHLNGGLSLGWVLAERRWSMVIPRNDWCDGWQGLGFDDPVDPVHHFGFTHEDRALAFVEAGGAGFGVASDQIYLWGTSAGGGAALSSAYRLGRVSGVVWDSGFANFFLYYELPGSDGLPATAELEHIFGGPPYTGEGLPNGEIYERYSMASATSLLESGASLPRTYAGWNEQDQQMDPVHGQAMEHSIASGLAVENGGIHNFNHPYPGEDYHVQTVYKTLPLGYYTYALAEFLAGADLVITEAEQGCSDLPCVGSMQSVVERSDFAAMSGAAGRLSALGEVGTVAEGFVPAEFAAGTRVRVTFAFALASSELLDAADVVATIVAYEGSTEVARLPIEASRLVPPGARAAERDLLTQYANNWLEFTVGDPSKTRVEFRSSGVGELHVDSILWLSSPP